MEQNKAVLIADLSGYTALTETHGASIAAEMVSKFSNIAKDSLYGDSILHQCIGDEVMIVSSSADHLMNTARLLIQNCTKEHLFLQVHGGLHYGKILLRDNNYFGSPINIASRIATTASKGTLWCSSDFIHKLSAQSDFLFSLRGKHSFKNVSKAIDVYELTIENIYPFHIDPVCRMQIHNQEAETRHPYDPNVFFCSSDCLEAYIKRKRIRIQPYII